MWVGGKKSYEARAENQLENTFRAVLEHRNGVEIQLSRKFFRHSCQEEKESNSICKIDIRIGSVEGNLERLRNPSRWEALIAQLS